MRGVVAVEAQEENHRSPSAQDRSSPQIEGQETQSPKFDRTRHHVEEGQRLLGELLENETFREELADGMAKTETRVLGLVRHRIDRALVKPLVEEEAFGWIRRMAPLSPIRAEDRALKKKLLPSTAEALNGVTHLSYPVDGVNRTFELSTEREELGAAIAKQEHPDFLKQLELATRLYEIRKVQVRERVEQVREEFISYRDTPDLQHALSLWGRTPDSKGDRGEDGAGFHAGVMHYFEYRSNPKKSGRYRKEPLADFGVQGFIDFSLRYESALRTDDLRGDPLVKLATVVSDEHGRERRFVHTDSHYFVSFQDSGELPCYLTVIPCPYNSRTHDRLLRATQREINDLNDTHRLNRLGQERKLVGVYQGQPDQDQPLPSHI